jgi:hypothetical protein
MTIATRDIESPTRGFGFPGRRTHRVIGTVLATALTFVALAPVAGASSKTAKRIPAVGLVPFPGDVFTVSSNGTLIAVDPNSTPPSAPLFNLAGSSLNETWGQFDSVTATSGAKALTRMGTISTDFRITLTGLIPNGVYSLFYRTFTPDSANPVCGTVGAHDPLVALTAAHPKKQAPDSSSFAASTTGSAAFHARVAGNLLAAAQLQVWIIYHFDGHVYGPVPNMGESTSTCRSSFGIDAMRQLIIIQK